MSVWRLLRLLDILAGRKNCIHVSGDILVDEERQPHDFKYMSGYVVQVDSIMSYLYGGSVAYW